MTCYVYDGLGRLIDDVETQGTMLEYSYDKAGNRTKVDWDKNASYTYDANNRLITETESDYYEGTTVTTYTYDGNGNLLSRLTLAANGTTSSETYSYNGLNQLVSATVNGTTTYYTYNGQGIRTTKEADGIVTSYYLDGGNVVAEETDGETTTYLRGLHLFRRQNSKETEYYFFNAHGDVVNTIGTDKKVTHTYYYDAFGEEKYPEKSDTNPFRYCGEYWDCEIGTYYLRARYYDPAICRFTQSDSVPFTLRKLPNDSSVIDILTLNLYCYCANNPIFYIDPSGHVVEIMHYKNPDRVYGHIDISINDRIYSFAVYDGKKKAFGFTGNGSIMVVYDKEKYWAARKEKGDKITGFTLNLTKEQEEQLLKTLNGYISEAKKLDKESEFADYYYGKTEDGLDTYTALSVPFVGENCIGFVNKAFNDANMPRDLTIPPAVDLPLSIYDSLNYAYKKYSLYAKIYRMLGKTYTYPNGCVIGKTVY